MLCSLIIPAYNAEKTIVSCLESALKQSLSTDEYEVIVVDDGSTDKTPQIVSKYPVRLIQQENQGPAVARNRGADEAGGSILIFTDSDCELDFDFLKKIIATFEQDSEIVGVQGSYKTRQNEFMAQFGQVEIETRYKRMAKNKYIDFIGTYAAAYRKDIFQKYGGFDTGFPLASGEDTEFSYKLHESGHKMVFEPGAFVYHQHPAKLKHYLKSKFYRGYWRVRLYKKHPEKTVRDSYTPQSLKIQVMSIPFLLLCGLLSVFNSFWLILVFLFIVSFLFFSIPFIRIFRARKYPYYSLVPIILLLRAFAIPLGMTFGIINEIKNQVNPVREIV
ncbi:MAG: glycosyltransferase [Deltaproteobacteria bacterium]|nr:glycosyltransferase [Deltaproteobacteria bacterium]